MLLASYTSTRPGVQGIANRLIRWRLDGRTSHSEIVFTPFDGVDDLMLVSARGMRRRLCAPDDDAGQYPAESDARNQ